MIFLTSFENLNIGVTTSQLSYQRFIACGYFGDHFSETLSNAFRPSPDTIEKICQCLDIEAFQLFQKQEKTDSLKENKNTEISQSIIENLYAKLKEDLYKFLKKDIETILGSVKK